MTRFSDAATNMRDRLRAVKGVIATVFRDGTTLAENVQIVQTDLRRFARTNENFILESGESGFLVGTDVLDWEPAQGDLIQVGSVSYRVMEREDLGILWTWHDTARTTRLVFCKEWE